MKKYLSFALALLLAQSVFAADNPKVFININSPAGKSMLKSELDSKQDLLKTAQDHEKTKHEIASSVKNQGSTASELGNMEAMQSTSQAKTNSCEINKMKRAIAKIIGRLNSLEANAMNDQSEIESLKTQLYKFQHEKRSPEVLASVVQTATPEEVIVKNTGNNAPETNTIMKISEKVKKTKVVCDKTTKRIFDKNKIRESYFYFKTPKHFTVKRNYANAYDYPILEGHSLAKLMKGRGFKADMYTAAGWVHAINYGWVKGYKLDPVFMGNKKLQKKWVGKDSAYITVEKEDCNKVEVKE